MGTNQSFIEKADLSVQNLVNEGGYLVPVQAKQFMELLIEESVLLGLVTTIPMAGPSYQISKAGFTGRVLHRAAENTALPIAKRSKPELGKVTLNTTEFIAEARIPYGVVEDNIANGTFNDVMMRYLAKAVSRDMEDFAINSTVGNVDDDLAAFDGIIAKVTTHVVSAGGVRLTKSVLKQMVQTLPSRYLRAQKNLAFITSKNAAIDYADSLANRIGVMADNTLTGSLIATPAEYAGYPVVPIPLWPENLGVGTDQTVIILGDPKNINVGIQRQVRVETDRDISAREFIVVATVRYAVDWAHEPASVKATGITASAGA